MDSDGQKVFTASQAHVVPRNPQNESWRQQGFLMHSEFVGAVKFPKPGDYSFEILVDGINLKSLPFHVLPMIEEPTAA